VPQAPRPVRQPAARRDEAQEQAEWFRFIVRFIFTFIEVFIRVMRERQ
jgi:hypothetical protein